MQKLNSLEAIPDSPAIILDRLARKLESVFAPAILNGGRPHLRDRVFGLCRGNAGIVLAHPVIRGLVALEEMDK